MGDCVERARKIYHDDANCANRLTSSGGVQLPMYKGKTVCQGVRGGAAGYKRELVIVLLLTYGELQMR